MYAKSRSFAWRLRLSSGAGVMACCLLIAPAYAAASMQPEGDGRELPDRRKIAPAPAADEWLLLPYYRGEAIGDLIPVLMQPNGMSLVLAEPLLAALGVEYTLALDGSITGRRHPGDLPFYFGTDGRWQADNARGQLGSADFVLFQGELYLSREAIARVFPVRLTVDTTRQQLVIEATGPLPLDIARNRELARARLSGQENLSPPPLSHFPYQPIGRPAGDIRLTFNHNTGDNKQTRLSYDSLVTNELGYATGLVFLRGDDSRLSDMRVRLGREAFDGNAFGVPGLVSAFAGDVNGAAVPLVGNVLGRGLALSSYPLDRPDSFDRTRVEGDAPADWDVELYRGSELLAFSKVGGDGRYLFEDVPLLFGNNELQVVLYGPEGQQREERRTFRVGSGMTPVGKVQVRGMLGEYNRRLFDRLVPHRHGNQGLTYSLQADMGLIRFLSASAYATRAPEGVLFNDRLRDNFGGGLRLSLPMLYLEGDAVWQDGGGHAWTLGGSTGLGKVSLSFGHADYNNFRSARASRGTLAIEQETRLQVSTALQFIGRNVGLSGGFEQWSFENGHKEMLARGATRFSLGPVYLNQQFEWRKLDYSTGITSERLDWLPGASTSFGPLRISLDARMDLKRSRLDYARLTGNWRFDRDTTALLGVSQSNVSRGGSPWSFTGGFARDFGAFRASVTGTRQNSGAYFFGLGLNTSFGMNRGGGLRFSSRDLAQYGAADVLVYHDRDFNGGFDPTIDSILPNVGVQTDRRRNVIASTDAHGRAFVAGLDTQRPVTLGIDTSTIDDPFLVMADSGLSFAPRPGQPFSVQIAIVDSGEIGGTLLAERNGEAIGLSNVVLELYRITGSAPIRHAGNAFNGANGMFNFEGYADGLGPTNGGSTGIIKIGYSNVDSYSSVDSYPNGSSYSNGFKSLDGNAVAEPQPATGERQLVKVIRSQQDGGFLFDLVPPGRYIVCVREGQIIRGFKVEPAEQTVRVTPDRLNVDDVELRLLAPGELVRNPPRDPELAQDIDGSQIAARRR